MTAQWFNFGSALLSNKYKTEFKSGIGSKKSCRTGHYLSVGGGRVNMMGQQYSKALGVAKRLSLCCYICIFWWECWGAAKYLKVKGDTCKKKNIFILTLLINNDRSLGCQWFAPHLFRWCFPCWPDIDSDIRLQSVTNLMWCPHCISSGISNSLTFFIKNCAAIH